MGVHRKFRIHKHQLESRRKYRSGQLSKKYLSSEENEQPSMTNGTVQKVSSDSLIKGVSEKGGEWYIFVVNLLEF